MERTKQTDSLAARGLKAAMNSFHRLEFDLLLFKFATFLYQLFI